jgi:hypothetical protein
MRYSRNQQLPYAGVPQVEEQAAAKYSEKDLKRQKNSGRLGSNLMQLFYF